MHMQNTIHFKVSISNVILFQTLLKYAFCTEAFAKNTIGAPFSVHTGSVNRHKTHMEFKLFDVYVVQLKLIFFIGFHNQCLTEIRLKLVQNADLVKRPNIGEMNHF